MAVEPSSDVHAGEESADEAVPLAAVVTPKPLELAGEKHLWEAVRVVPAVSRAVPVNPQTH